ncbi:MAG: DEAD/DEAH box helicase family protein [Prevotella sp.]|nr:DEAD/DEAH box helicase family protein [Prevotella sp.]
MQQEQQKCDFLLLELEQLRMENARLKEILQANGIAYDVVSTYAYDEKVYSDISFPEVHLGKEERIELFRSLFRGREDVFARRWYSKVTNKSGYQPVCVNEWRRGLCDKKAIKCAECPNRNFLSLGYDDVCRHLIGNDENGCDVVGIYAIMSDNNCAFLCTDFDDKSCKHRYKDDVLAFVGVCRDWNIPYSIERSRSGNGAHVWIFFNAVVPAYKARRLGNAILTEAMSRDGRMAFDSYDRFFPNQDRMPEGGFGNLVALPLQGKARKDLNSVFVDDEFFAYRDQWTYLAQVQKIEEQKVDVILQNHIHEDLGVLSTSSESKPWVTPVPQNINSADFTKVITITVADKIYIPLNSVSAKVLNHIKRIAAFRNPEFYKKQAMRMSTYGIPRIISCFDITDDYLAMPRGCKEAIMKLLDSNGAKYTIVDETNHGKAVAVTFLGTEREEQLDAIESLLPFDNAVLHATTAFGKTVTAASLIARRKVNTLILVHSKALLTQWHERLSEFLDIDYKEPEPVKKRGRRKAFSPIGCLDSTTNTVHGVIDIALLQSCFEDGEVKSFVQDYGMVIVDECHHVSSITFEKVLKSVKAQYVHGLTATPIRKDGQQPIIFMQCGPIRFSADSKSQIQKQSFRRYLIPRFTSYRSITDDKQSFPALQKSLAADEVRNSLIVDDIRKTLESGRTPIVLTGIKQHVNLLAERLKSYANNVIQLTGTCTAKEKREALQRLQEIPADEPLVIVATGQYVGEGFDYPRLDTLFLALPISWKGRLEQYAGRLHRENDGKKDVRIYDYIDIHEPLCDNMYHNRLRAYAAIGYQTIQIGQPTLFGKIGDLPAYSEDSQIFNEMTFFKSLIKDIATAKQSVVISSPRLYRVTNNKLVSLLKEQSANGVEVAIVTAMHDEQCDFLQSSGLHVTTKPNLKLCTIIIDKSLVWYGSVNALGFYSDKDNIIKLKDDRIAAEMLNVLFG